MSRYHAKLRLVGRERPIFNMTLLIILIFENLREPFLFPPILIPISPSI